MSKFQKDFLWGSASAAYQIEGAASTDGKGKSIWDVYSNIPGNTFKDTTGEVAIDFYNKFEEDIELMKEMGLKAYRFSVSWPRVIPEGNGKVNPQGIEFYHKVIDKLIECGVEPVLTIYHWDLPQALQEQYEGWESRKIIEDFDNYCRLLFKEYGNKVKYWVTLNEQNVFTSLGYLWQLHPPKKSDFQTYINVNHIANLANAKAIKSFRELCPSGLIGPSFAYGPTYAKTCKPEDVLAMEDAQELNNFLWLDVYARGEYSPLHINLLKKIGITLNVTEEDKEILKGSKPDFMGMNYYSTTTVAKEKEVKNNDVEQKGNTVQATENTAPTEALFTSASNEFVKLTDWNWIIDPQGLRVGLRRITSRYNLPIMITENGLGAYDNLVDGKVADTYRIDYLKDHIDAIEDAIEDGCTVLGYCTWSFQDLF